MKRIGIISTTAALFLVLGITAPAGAQEKDNKQDKDKQEQTDKHEKDSKPEKQQPEAKPGKQQEARPEKPEPAAKPDNRQEARPDMQPQKQDQGKQAARQDEPKQQPQHQQAQPQEQSKQPARQEERQQPQQQASRPSQQEQHSHAVEQRGAWQEHRARSWESEHRTWQQRGGYTGYRIPEATFSISFGEVHSFRIYSLPVLIVGESPRFQYGGFWFSLVDPWPETWSDDWYETDDVYIDYYGDGYYMYNRRHPGVRIAINVFVG
ncbi:MAG: hypothetical protein LAO20_11155 [Acidobacteriia bacterium]|nr:hypothetical protein [Terriglobia bacterium]